MERMPMKMKLLKILQKKQLKKMSKQLKTSKMKIVYQKSQLKKAESIGLLN